MKIFNGIIESRFFWIRLSLNAISWRGKNRRDAKRLCIFKGESYLTPSWSTSTSSCILSTEFVSLKSSSKKPWCLPLPGWTWCESLWLRLSLRSDRSVTWCQFPSLCQHETIYPQGLEGGAVSDKDGVCVISFAVEGKEARLDPLMRCDNQRTT